MVQQLEYRRVHAQPPRLVLPSPLEPLHASTRRSINIPSHGHTEGLSLPSDAPALLLHSQVSNSSAASAAAWRPGAAQHAKAQVANASVSGSGPPGRVHASDDNQFTGAGRMLGVLPILLFCLAALEQV